MYPGIEEILNLKVKERRGKISVRYIQNRIKVRYRIFMPAFIYPSYYLTLTGQPYSRFLRLTFPLPSPLPSPFPILNERVSPVK